MKQNHNQTNNQSGFGLIDIILIITVVGLIGFIAFQAYQGRNKAQTTQTETSPSPSPGSPSPNAPTPIPGSSTITYEQTGSAEARLIKQRLQHSYQTLMRLSGNSDDTYSTRVASLRSSGYLTANAQADIKGVHNIDPVSCSQSTAPNYSIGEPVITGSTATADITGNYLGGKTIIKLDLVKANGQWAIDNFTCK